MLDDELDEVRKLLDAPSGLILVAGPTGSGKTHSLYAFLKHLNDGSRKIHTLEEPIEFIVPGLIQSQVNRRAGLDFADLLYATLRHSPDVIMIGEIRDERTAQIAIRAANSGQLVLATIHAQDASSAIQSMLALNAIPQFLGTTLLGVIAQRLVRRLCPACRESIGLPAETQWLSELRETYEDFGPPSLYQSVGCDQCDQLGYDRMVCIPEILTAGSRVRHAIIEGYSNAELHDVAVQSGMRSMREACKLRIALGMATPEDLIALLPANIDCELTGRKRMPRLPHAIDPKPPEKSELPPIEMVESAS